MKVRNAMSIILFAIIFVGMLILFQKEEKAFVGNTLNDTRIAHPSVNQSHCDNIFKKESAEETRVIQGNQYYEIIQSGFLYYCHFYDRKGNVVKTEGPLTKPPKVELVDTSLIRFTYQAGTGIGTQWAFYYDTECERFSDVFQSVFDQWDRKVAYADTDRIIVRGIFDQTGYYREFAKFENTFSKVAEPFIDAHFVGSDGFIKITYLSGDDYREVTELFAL